MSHDDAVEHFGFVVRYRQGEDVSLEEHADASVVTMNVCLGKEWEGGELVMGKYASPYARNGLAAERSPAITHTPGRVLIHRGQRKRKYRQIKWFGLLFLFFVIVIVLVFRLFVVLLCSVFCVLCSCFCSV